MTNDLIRVNIYLTPSTYTKVKEGTLKIKFAIAPPGKPQAFSPYIEAVLHRK
jgi:hypothetical protein